MKKKIVSLFMAACVTAGFASGCKKNDETRSLTIDGKEIVLKVGETTYSADELLLEMLSSEEGANSVYDKILHMVVENAVETDANMEASYELMLDSFNSEVSTYATNNGVSEDEARETLLAEDGYTSIDDMRSKYLYEVKLANLREKYWEETKYDYYLKYLEERLPYYVSHALVKVSNNTSSSTAYTRGAYSFVASSEEAKALYDIYSMLVEGKSFKYIMNHASEDTGSNGQNTGIVKGYHMDDTTNFVSEFLHGVITFDALLKNKTDKVKGITDDVMEYYESTGTSGYNFNVINASDIVYMGEHATDTYSSSSTTNINTYENTLKAGTEDEYVETSTGTIYSNYGSTALYNRTIMFNQLFNTPGISVIAYDLADANAIPSSVNHTTLNINGVDKEVLTDENGNIVFIVCAKGDSNDLWIHFLTVNESPFDENIELFYSFDVEKTIEKMADRKKEALKAAGGLTDEEVNTQVNAYKTTLEAYKTYIDLTSASEKQKDKNTVIEELEGYVKTYAERGTTSGAVAADMNYLDYDMVEYYIKKGNLTISDETFKNLFLNYLDYKRSYMDTQIDNSIAKRWEEYYKELSTHAEYAYAKIPMECSTSINGTANTLCKYNYETGFEILITYKNAGSDTSTNKYSYFTDTTNLKDSYHIGDYGIYTLPTNLERENMEFAGWYSTSDFQESSRVTQIDMSRSTSSNRIVLYAKWNSVGGND